MSDYLYEGHPDDLSCGCDLADPHDEFHHYADPRKHCDHPECRADGDNDDRKLGLL
jgi:hypothetical protein